MLCPRCQAQNPVDARFCEDCGSRLSLACPRCAAEVSPAKRFCRACGADLSAVPAGAAPGPASYTPIAAHPAGFDPEQARTHYRCALSLADELGMRPLIAHCHLGLGKLSRRTGGLPKAQEHLTAAMAMYREMDMQSWLGKAEVELGPPDRGSA